MPLSDQRRHIHLIIPLSCDPSNCDGRADSASLLSVGSMASGPDGALYVGDYNHIRRISPDGKEVKTIVVFGRTQVRS